MNYIVIATAVAKTDAGSGQERRYISNLTKTKKFIISFCQFI